MLNSLRSMFGNKADLVDDSSNEDESGTSLLEANDPQLCTVTEQKFSPYRVWKVTIAIVAVVRISYRVCPRASRLLYISLGPAQQLLRIKPRLRHSLLLASLFFLR